MIDYIHNRDGRATSTQVSRMDDITEDVFTPEFYFLIKNTNDNEVTVEIRPAGQEKFITTVLYPGLKPELCSAVKISGETGLQYGY